MKSYVYPALLTYVGVEIINSRVEAWLTEQHPPVAGALKEMERQGQRRNFPIIGPVVGNFVSLMAKSIAAKSVLEMGSGFGYSAAWFATTLGPDAKIVHIDGSQALSDEAKDWLSQAGAIGQVQFHVGEACQIAESLEGQFDVVFIDIDKEDYPAAWQVAKQKVRVGGLIITDNTLWHGKVADPIEQDGATNGVRSYVATAMGDPDFMTTIVPLRDGVAVSLRLA